LGLEDRGQAGSYVEICVRYLFPLVDHQVCYFATHNTQRSAPISPSKQSPITKTTNQMITWLNSCPTPTPNLPPLSPCPNTSTNPPSGGRLANQQMQGSRATSIQNKKGRKITESDKIGFHQILPPTTIPLDLFTQLPPPLYRASVRCSGRTKHPNLI
jgi:hypothetical protein